MSILRILTPAFLDSRTSMLFPWIPSNANFLKLSTKGSKMQVSALSGSDPRHLDVSSGRMRQVRYSHA